MSCGKVYEKLWNNYITKYGDFRDRLETIRNDQQCFMPFRLPPLEQPSLTVPAPLSTSRKTSTINDNNKTCGAKLPSECSIVPTDLLLTLKQTDLDELEKLTQAENFPDNIFPINTPFRSTINTEPELSVTNNLPDNIIRSSKRFTSPLLSIFSKNNITQPILQQDDGSITHSQSKTIKSINRSERASTSYDLTANRRSNPYKQFLERLRKTEKTKLDNSNNKLHQKSFHSTADPNTHTHIQNLLAFLRSLDGISDNKQDSSTIDEDTLISLLSVDNHLSSTIYVPATIHQIDITPKSILHSLKKTSNHEQILNKILAEMSINKSNDLRLHANLPKQQRSSKEDSPSADLTEQDKELNSKLSNTYAVKAFKEYLIHRNKSSRLPEFFHDIDRYDEN